jgi:hypothetical protein
MLMRTYVVEMLMRLGLALFLSLALAVLMAWGWDRSDQPPVNVEQITDASAAATTPDAMSVQ